MGTMVLISSLKKHLEDFMDYEDDDFEKMDRDELVDVAKLLRDKVLMCYTFFVAKAGQFESVEPLIPVKPDKVTISDFIEKGGLEQCFLTYAQKLNQK
jgi:hypothetical protein